MATRRFGIRHWLRLAWILSVLIYQSPVTAFRPPLLSEELGCSPTLSLLVTSSSTTTSRTTTDRQLFYFDPAKLATDANFSRLRESELKHGRVSMLAVAGTMLTPVLKRLSATFETSKEDYPNGVLAVLKSLSVVDFFKVLVVCGILETIVLIQKDPTDMPGDYGWGWFGVRDKGLHERELIVELENGRLAMMAIVIQIVAEVVTGKSWEDQWTASLFQWIDSFQS